MAVSDYLSDAVYFIREWKKEFPDTYGPDLQQKIDDVTEHMDRVRAEIDGELSSKRA